MVPEHQTYIHTKINLKYTPNILYKKPKIDHRPKGKK